MLIAASLCAPAFADPAVCGDEALADTQRPDSSPQERFHHARGLTQNGDYDAAIREYRWLSVQYPDNVDYLFGEAQARFRAGQPACSLRLVSSARRLAPGYEDVWKLEHRVLQAIPGDEAGERLNALRTEAAGRFPGATWFHDDRVPERAVYRWETGINRETLDNGAADWQNLYAHILRRSPDDGFLSMTLTEHRRYSQSDTEVAVGGGFKSTGSWLVDGALTLSRSGQFLPEIVVDAGASRLLGNGWLAGFDLRYRGYADDTVNTVGLNVERYIGSFRAAYHIDSTRLASSSSHTHRGVLNYYAQSGSRYGLTLAVGDEIEVIAPGQLLEMDISAVALTGSHPVGERLSILWRVGTHRQDSLYRRTNVGLSIAGEF